LLQNTETPETAINHPTCQILNRVLRLI